jgi:hypothetical protein
MNEQYFNTKRERDEWLELHEKKVEKPKGENKAHWTKAEKNFLLNNGAAESLTQLNRSEKAISRKLKQLTKDTEIKLKRKNSIQKRIKFQDDVGEILQLNYKNDYSHHEKMPTYKSSVPIRSLLHK